MYVCCACACVCFSSSQKEMSQLTCKKKQKNLYSSASFCLLQAVGWMDILRSGPPMTGGSDKISACGIARKRDPAKGWWWWLPDQKKSHGVRSKITFTLKKNATRHKIPRIFSSLVTPLLNWTSLSIAKAVNAEINACLILIVIRV